MSPLTAAQSTALAEVEARAGDLSARCAMIIEHGESAWREYRSSAWYVERLRAEGFAVEEGSGGTPTAFTAAWRNGPESAGGLVIGLYAEYVAVPGNCQAADHTDPHSGLGIGALGGLLAIKAAMERHGIRGGLRFTGEPAEKARGSKPIHTAKGYYDGLAAILSFHPFYMLPLCNTVRLDTRCGAVYAMIYRFLCDAPEAWGRADGTPIPQSHSAVRARGANDALMLMYQSSKALREAMLPHQGGWSVSEAILTAGQATADNLPAGPAELQYMIRTPTIAMAEQLSAVLDRNAAAAMTGCRWKKHWVCKSCPGLANHAMTRLVWEAMQAAGPPQWDKPACEIRHGLGRTHRPVIHRPPGPEGSGRLRLAEPGDERAWRHARDDRPDCPRRRRHRRLRLTAPALRLSPADPFPLAGICDNPARPRLVDPSAQPGA